VEDIAPHYAPDLVESYLRRFVAFPSEHAVVACVLWAIHTHLLDAAETSPRLAAMSEEKGSGKTRLLEILSQVVRDPIMSMSASPAVIVRLVSQRTPTILLDEIDAVFGNAKAQEANLDLRSILNGGYRRGAKVHRCVTHGKKIETEELDAFAPVAVAGLRELPDTLASRSIIIRMKRRAPDEVVEQFRYRLHTAQAEPIRKALIAWCETHRDEIADAEPTLPAGIEDRAADIWEPLVAIADAAGGDWPKRARDAAVALTKSGVEETQSRGVTLLEHIREAIGQEPYIATTTLLDRLRERDESPWRDIKGKPLDSRGLALRLKGYGIKSKTVRVSGSTPKGYDSADFADAWKRYLAPSQDIRHKGNSRHIFESKNNFVADVSDVAGGMAEEEVCGQVICVRCRGAGCDWCELEPGSTEPEDDDWTSHRFGGAAA
jgi:hypothetical protein